MSRTIVALLVVLNLVWWVWERNDLAPLSLPSAPDGEPERMARQLHPEALRVQPLPSSAVRLPAVPASGSSPPPASTPAPTASAVSAPTPAASS